MMYITQTTEKKINTMVKADSRISSCGYILKEILNIVKARKSCIGVSIKNALSNGVSFDNKIIVDEGYNYVTYYENEAYELWNVLYPNIFEYANENGKQTIRIKDFNKLVRRLYNRFLIERG